MWFGSIVSRKGELVPVRKHKQTNKRDERNQFGEDGNIHRHITVGSYICGQQSVLHGGSDNHLLFLEMKKKENFCIQVKLNVLYKKMKSFCSR